MKLRSFAFRLKFNHPFHIAAGMRDHTDTVFTEITSDGMTGYGEAALPPYLIENTGTVINYLSKIKLPTEYDAAHFNELMIELHNSKNKNYPALAAIDIALHDLQGKLKGLPIRHIYNIHQAEIPLSAYTIGMGSDTEIEIKIKEAEEFRFFKLKLGGENDQELVKSFLKYSKAPFCVDVNRGWNDLKQAISMVKWLADAGCLFIEQPFEKEELDKTNELRKNSSIPVILDESVQTVEDVDIVKDYCDGINIKLVKCGGLYPAFKMIEAARANKLKVFIGCMSESTCGIGAAAQLAPLADWIDLDSPKLISNDPFEGVEYKDGKIVLNNEVGTGVWKKNIL